MVKLKFLDRPRLSIWERILFLDFTKGLRVTFKNLIRKTITTKYPYEKLTPPKRFRGSHAHRVKDGNEPPSFSVLGKFMEIGYDESRCVACYMCQQACPMPTLFKIEAVQLPNGKKRVTKFEMNLLNCLYCGLCVDACPVDCLIMTDVYESASYNRGNCVIKMDDMSDRGRDFDRRRLKEKDRIWIDDEERTKLWGQIRWT